MHKIKNILMLSAVVSIIGLAGCATHLEDVAKKLPGKEHKPNPAMAGLASDHWRPQLYYPNENRPR
jgi:protein involved in sex pheromone biosynthesis